MNGLTIITEHHLFLKTYVIFSKVICPTYVKTKNTPLLVGLPTEDETQELMDKKVYSLRKTTASKTARSVYALIERGLMIVYLDSQVIRAM